MTPERALEFLTAFHDDRKGARLSEQATTYYLQYLGSLTPEDVRDVVVKHAVERFSRFPTIQQLRGVAREVLDGIREEENRRRKRDRRPLFTSLPPVDAANPAHARASFLLIRAIMEQRIRPAQRLEAFRKMAAKWPRVGWEGAIAEDEQWQAGTWQPCHARWRMPEPAMRQKAPATWHR
jgi:hypothetical protein